MDASDERLIRRIRHADRGALEVLYRRYAAPIWRYAHLRARCREAAADIVQDTFLRALRAAPNFEGRASPGTWLFAIARSAAVDYARRQQRRQQRDAGPAVLKLVPAAEVRDPLVQAEDVEALRAAIATLRPAQRDVLALCTTCELSVRDAAGALGWSESRVKVTLHRARRNLRDALCRKETGISARAGDAG